MIKKKLGILLTLFAACFSLCGCSGDTSSTTPLEFNTEYWRGEFRSGQFLAFMDAHIVVEGDSASGEYHWSNYGNGRNFDGKLTGKVEGNTLKLNLEIPDDPKASTYSDFTIELNMAEANPQETQKARAFNKNQKGAPKEMVEKEKIMKLYGTASYKYQDKPETMSGYLAESVKRDKD